MSQLDDGRNGIFIHCVPVDSRYSTSASYGKPAITICPPSPEGLGYQAAPPFTTTCFTIL